MLNIKMLNLRNIYGNHVEFTHGFQYVVRVG